MAPADGRVHKSAVVLSSRLFWFLKEGTRVDLTEPSAADLYVQHIVTHGSANDVQLLTRTLNAEELRASLGRVKPFLPPEVRTFWEDWCAGHQ